MAAGGTWKVGSINVPSGASSVNIPTGGSPQVAVFFGSNFTAEDSIVTTGWRGVFRGMAARKWNDAGTLVQHASCAIQPGQAHYSDDYAVLQLDNAGSTGILYRATASFGATSVTLNFTHGASGYKVVYMILTGVPNAVALGSRQVPLVHSDSG